MVRIETYRAAVSGEDVSDCLGVGDFTDDELHVIRALVSEVVFVHRLGSVIGAPLNPATPKLDHRELEAVAVRLLEAVGGDPSVVPPAPSIGQGA